MDDQNRRAPVSVVVVTRDRCAELLTTLAHLGDLPERPPVIVVDNGSTDGTPARVRDRFPEVRLVDVGRNLGATGRNLGVSLAATPYVAFADDDSWWAPGALQRAADHLDAAPRLALLMGRILVGADARLDPTCAVMAASPLPREPDLPGPSVLGFVACGAVVRRRPFLDVGGFDDLLFFFGEEQLLALDLARAGWGLAYVDDVVAHHHPSPARDPQARRRRQVRNDLLTTWMRRPADVALARTAHALGDLGDPAVRGALGEAARRLPAAASRRAVLPAELERWVRVLEDDPQPAGDPRRGVVASLRSRTRRV